MTERYQPGPMEWFTLGVAYGLLIAAAVVLLA